MKRRRTTAPTPMLKEGSKRSGSLTLRNSALSLPQISAINPTNNMKFESERRTMMATIVHGMRRAGASWRGQCHAHLRTNPAHIQPSQEAVGLRSYSVCRVSRKEETADDNGGGGGTLSIDRSGLRAWNVPPEGHARRARNIEGAHHDDHESRTPLLRELESFIFAKGPMTVAEYMRHALLQ